jgi:hypothetical protein
MAEALALSHGWVMAQQRHTHSTGRLTRGNAGVLVRGRGYVLAVALVTAGILGLELSSGVGWALILLGGWLATLLSQRAADQVGTAESEPAAGGYAR